MTINGSSDTQILNAIGDIEENFADVECPKKFECCKTNFAKIGQVKIGNKDNFLECLEKSATDCGFSLPCDDKYYCLCPVRIHIANNLNL